MSLSAYAREQNLAPWAAYHSRAQLTREGLWRAAPGARPRRKSSTGVPLGVARVRVVPEPLRSALIVRVQLLYRMEALGSNGTVFVSVTVQGTLADVMTQLNLLTSRR